MEISQWNVDSAYSANTAGFMHAELDELSVDLDTVTFTSLEAVNQGGGFYATLWKDVTFNDVTVNKAKAPSGGGFMYTDIDTVNAA